MLASVSIAIRMGKSVYRRADVQRANSSKTMATIYQRGSRWYLNWSEGGRQHRRSLGPITRAEAERARKIKEAELATGMQTFSTAPLFSDFADEYLHWYEAEYPASYARTEQIIRVHLDPVFGMYAMDQIDPRVVEQYKADRLRSVRIVGANTKTPRKVKTKSSTVSKELRALHAMFNRAVEWRVIAAHPFPAVRDPKKMDSKPPRFYTKHELQKLYAVSYGTHRWTWQLMANTGLRRSEALMLRKEWDLGEKLRILSTEGARTKSARWREVPISPGAREALDRLASDRELILPPVAPPSLSRAFVTCARRADLDGSLHCLRHTFCSHLVMQGVPLRTVQILAGHSSSKVTEQYAHLAPDHMVGVLDGLHL